MRSDAYAEPEREQRAGDDARVRRRRERGAEQHIRQMPRGVRRMKQSPVVTPAARPQRVERRAEPRVARGGRWALRRAHDDPTAEAHMSRPDPGKPRFAPVALDIALRMRAIEALDVRAEE